MSVNIRKLLRDYRAACRAARIDPAVGPATTFQAANAIAESRKRLNRPRDRWWLEIDWLDDEGLSHSDTEFMALLRLWVRTLYAAYQAEGDEFVVREHHRMSLRDLLALRGETLEWVEDEDGEILAVILPVDQAVDGVLE